MEQTLCKLKSMLFHLLSQPAYQDIFSIYKTELENNT